MDLLKIPHHGYNTSSSSVFLYIVSPEVAVGMGDYRTKVHNLYSNMGTEFLCDNLNGYVHICSDGTNCKDATSF